MLHHFFRFDHYINLLTLLINFGFILIVAAKMASWKNWLPVVKAEDEEDLVDPQATLRVRPQRLSD